GFLFSFLRFQACRFLVREGGARDCCRDPKSVQGPKHFKTNPSFVGLGFLFSFLRFQACRFLVRE
ncbi:MAG: hypothetical protein ACO3FI_05680, partial [Cyclobacteriaceae bacterium]